MVFSIYKDLIPCLIVRSPFFGEYSNFEEIIIKFAQLTSLERKKNVHLKSVYTKFITHLS